MIKEGKYSIEEVRNFLGILGHPVQIKLNRQIWRKNGVQITARRDGTWAKTWVVKVKKIA